MSQIDENRFGAVKIGEDLHLLSFRGQDRLGVPFHWEADLIRANPGVDFNKLIGESASVRLSLRDHPKRYFSGIVRSIAEAGVHQGLPKYRAQIVPWLWFASRSSDCRIFQEMTPVEVFKSVISEYDMGIGGVEDELTRGSYPKREYIVQYNETALDFVRRLMEEEGVYFAFRHDEGGKHALHLYDGPESHGKEDIGEIEYRAPGHGEAGTIGYIREWQASGHALTGEVALRDWNFTQPQSPLQAKHVAQTPHALGDFERFSYPGRFETEDEGGEYARVMLEAIRAGQTVIEGVADNVKIETGKVFTFKPDGKLVHESHGGKYLVTSCSYEFNVPGLFSRAIGQIAQAEGPLWRVKFTAIPSDTPFRTPQTTRKPRVPGPQTAIVTGPSGEELYLDEHGRVKVQFHWDRDGKSDESSSCWLRVAQHWAGKGWGGQFWPRIGQEVIVDFIDGDPDRPIITGRVYNAENKPPYDPRQFATISAIKTSSSKGGEGFNELRFEDKADSEMIWIHAQKRMDFRVRGQFRETNYASREIRIGWEKDGDRGGDHNILVRNNTNRIIENDYYDTLLGERHQTIEKDAFFDLQENRTTKVAETDSLNAKVLIVATEEKISLKTDKFLAEGSGGVDIKSGADLKLGATQNLHAKGGQNLNLEGGMNATVKGGMNTVIEGGMGVTIKCGGSFIAIGPAGVDIVGPMVKLNSGGAAGSGQAASDPAGADEAEDFEITEPLTALVADDGKPGKVSKAGPGGGRSNKKRTIKAKNPPKSPPIPPSQSAKPKAPTKPAPPPPPPQSAKPCAIASLDVECKHKRKAGPSGVLQVVADTTEKQTLSWGVGSVKASVSRSSGGEERIKGAVSLNKDGGKGDRKQICLGANASQPAESDWKSKPSEQFDLKPPEVPAEARWLANTGPRVVYVHGRGCDAAGKRVCVEHYPNVQHAVSVDITLFDDWVKKVNDGIGAFSKTFFSVLPVEIKPQIKGPKGHFNAAWGWKENSDWRVYHEIELDIGLKPVLGFSLEFTISAVKTAGAVAGLPPILTDVVSEHVADIKIGMNFGIEGNLIVGPRLKVFTDGTQEPSGQGKGELVGSVGMSITFKAGSKYVVSASAEGSVTTKLTLYGTFTVDREGIFAQPGLKLDPATLKVEAEFKAFIIYSTSKSKEWTPWGTIDLWKGEKRRLLPRG